jgi:endo-1,4-beta-D-glucanase Y
MTKRKANQGQDEGGGPNTKKAKVSYVVPMFEQYLTSSFTDEWTWKESKQRVRVISWADAAMEFEVDYVASDWC